MTAGWAPIRVSWRQEKGYADLARTAGMSFDEPFFDETIERCLRRPFNLLFRRDVELDDLPEPAVEPAGLVLHASRSGSTLVAQLLRGVPETLVVAEAAAVDAVLRGGSDRDDERRAEWLRRVVAALGLARGDVPDRFFLKLDAWSTFDLPLLRRAFPAVPWVFVYRDPLEILVSHARRRGLHMIPGALAATVLDLPHDGPSRLPPEELMARMLGAILGAAAEAADDPRGRLVHWRDLPRAVPDVVAPHFGLRLDAVVADRLLTAAQADAKNPALPFVDDAAGKRAEASPALRAACDRWARPAYEELESVRAQSRAAA